MTHSERRRGGREGWKEREKEKDRKRKGRGNVRESNPLFSNSALKVTLYFFHLNLFFIGKSLSPKLKHKEKLVFSFIWDHCQRIWR
jgi:hypothetical protein